MPEPVTHLAVDPVPATTGHRIIDRTTSVALAGCPTAGTRGTQGTHDTGGTA